MLPKSQGHPMSKYKQGYSSRHASSMVYYNNISKTMNYLS
jgi:hypothetical protein